MNFNIALLRGDGIGPEIVDSAVAVLHKIGEKYGISIVVSISLDKEEIPEALQDKIAVAL